MCKDIAPLVKERHVTPQWRHVGDVALFGIHLERILSFKRFIQSYLVMLWSGLNMVGPSYFALGMSLYWTTNHSAVVDLSPCQLNESMNLLKHSKPRNGVVLCTSDVRESSQLIFISSSLQSITNLENVLHGLILQLVPLRVSRCLHRMSFIVKYSPGSTRPLQLICEPSKPYIYIYIYPGCFDRFACK